MNWQAIESLVTHLGTEHFSQVFFEFWDDALGIDQCTAWKISPLRPPITLVAERPGEKEKIQRLCHIYAAEMYGGDPQIQHQNQPVAVNRVETRKMRPGEYRRVLFEEAGLQEKIFMLCHHGDNAYYINLYRRQGRRAFSERDLEICRTRSAVATAFLDKHLGLLPSEALTTAEPKPLLHALETFFSDHPAKLSQREASTCAYIVTGHSNEAISLHLGVSLNTVRTFRRRAYAKLHLATQSELFALYLENAAQ